MSAKKFEYVLLLDDIVVDRGEILETDQEVAEYEIENNIMADVYCNRYTIWEVTK